MNEKNNLTKEEKLKKAMTNILSNFITAAITFTLVMILTNCFKLAQVQGNSMNPTLQNGDFIIVSAITKPADQDILILDVHDTDIDTDSIIKRYYEEKSTNNAVWVEGDNKEHSLDSRKLGTFEEERIIGVAIFDLSQFKKLR